MTNSNTQTMPQTTTCPCECHTGTSWCNFNGGCGDGSHRRLPLPQAITRRNHLGLGLVYEQGGREVHITWDDNFRAHLVELIEPGQVIGTGARFQVTDSTWTDEAKDALAARVLAADPATLPRSYVERRTFDFLK